MLRKSISWRIGWIDQMKQLVQWNEGHAYTFDRATLIKMLDDALATARPRTE